MYQSFDASQSPLPRRGAGFPAWAPQRTGTSHGFPRRPRQAAHGSGPKRPRILWSEDGSDLDLPGLLAAGPAVPASLQRTEVPQEAAADSQAAASMAATPAAGIWPFPRPALPLPKALKETGPVKGLLSPRGLSGTAAGVSLAALLGFLLFPFDTPETASRSVAVDTIRVQPEIASAPGQVSGDRFQQSFSEAGRDNDPALLKKIQDRVPAALANRSDDPMPSLVSQTAEPQPPDSVAAGQDGTVTGETGLTLSRSLAQSPEAHGASAFLQPASDPAPQTEAAASVSPAAYRLQLGERPTDGTATASVNLRSAADMNAGIIGVVPQGATLSVGACDKWWCAVSHAGKTGYIGRKFIGTAAAQAG